MRRCCYKHFLVIDDVDFVCVVVKRKISRCRRIDIIHYWNVYTNSLKIQSHSHSINNTWRNVQQKSVQQNNVLHKETSNYNFKSTFWTTFGISYLPIFYSKDPPLLFNFRHLHIKLVIFYWYFISLCTILLK